MTELLAAHADFWEGRGLFVHRVPYVPAGELHLPVAGQGPASGGTTLQPDMLDPLDFLQPGSGGGPVEGDVLCIRCAIKLPWMEAIMGCPLTPHPNSGAVWAGRCPGDPFGVADAQSVLAGNPWLEKLVAFTGALAAHSDGSYFATQATLRGPSDMADAMLGTEALILAMHDCPADVHRLLDVCADVFIETARAQWAAIPPLEGGYVSRYGLWAPGRVARCQADLAAMLSPDLYRDLVMPHDLKVMRAFGYTILHTHSAYPHLAEAYLDEDVPSALQVGIDEPPFGPPVADLVPFLKRVLEHKPLIFHGPVSAQEADLLARELPAKGLFLDLAIQSPSS